MGSRDTISTLKAKIRLEEGIVPSLERLTLGLGKTDESHDYRRMDSFWVDNNLCLNLYVRRFPLMSDQSRGFASAAGLLSEEPAGQLKGYFVHPIELKKPLDKVKSVVRPVERYRLRYVGFEGRRELGLGKYLPLEATGYHCVDSHLGLLVLQEPAYKYEYEHPKFVVWDPASGQYACLPSPPIEAMKQNAAFVMNDSTFDIDFAENIGGAILLRKEEELLEFEMAYITMEREGSSTTVRPRAWIATYDGKDCSWNCACSSGTIKMEEPCYIDKYCVRANGKLFWHVYRGTTPQDLVIWSVVSFDPVLKVFREMLIPDASRVGEDSYGGGGLAAAWVGPYEDLYLSTLLQTKKSDEWTPMMFSHRGLQNALDEVASVRSRNRRVTRVMDFDGGCPGSVLIKTSGNGKFRYHIGSEKLDRLVTSAGLEWGHPVFPYFR